MSDDDEAELPDPSDQGCATCSIVDTDTLPWDPLFVGTTCGGLQLIGGHVCPACGTAYLSKRSRPVERWKVTGSGRSVDTGTTRIRCEAMKNVDDPGAATADLMTRISRLPDLERAVAAIRAAIDREAHGPELIHWITSTLATIEIKDTIA